MTNVKVRQITNKGVILPVDFVDEKEVFYIKRLEKTNPIQTDWDTVLGAFRVPISVWNEQTAT